MGLDKVVVQIPTNVHYPKYVDILDLSPEELTEFSEDIIFLSGLPPLPITKKFEGKKIDYSRRYRKIRVLRAFQVINVTREIELERGLPEGLYDFANVPSNSVFYDITDHGDVEGWEYIPRETMLGSATYTQEEVRIMRKKPLASVI